MGHAQFALTQRVIQANDLFDHGAGFEAAIHHLLRRLAERSTQLGLFVETA